MSAKIFGITAISLIAIVAIIASKLARNKINCLDAETTEITCEINDIEKERL